MTYDGDVVDTTARGPSRGSAIGTAPLGTTGAGQEAERIMRDHMDTTSNDRMRQGSMQQGDLGKFGFEK
ncbi:hypothetical protein Tdes44962_MAKER10534 [Teratosphaeria destructans]|uniref:Uncharacterized protein n=1 Tax=Teratosphaeria destructans TaxID=418781 RepID=A0A9W7SZ10_9PEZI|nr:hypothetical protein Tdes44962_MAKER10534 [Teratosphaeria destructans]